MNYEKFNEELIADEGFSNSAYKDHIGNWTIGVGHLITSKEERLIESDLSDTRVICLLDDDVCIVMSEIESHLPSFYSLPEEVQHIIANMVFNLGWPRFSGFKNMLAAIHSEDWQVAAEEMYDSKWRRQVPNRAGRLIERMAALA